MKRWTIHGGYQASDPLLLLARPFSTPPLRLKHLGTAVVNSQPEQQLLVILALQVRLRQMLEQ